MVLKMSDIQEIIRLNIYNL